MTENILRWGWQNCTDHMYPCYWNDTQSVRQQYHENFVALLFSLPNIEACFSNFHSVKRATNERSSGQRRMTSFKTGFQNTPATDLFEILAYRAEIEYQDIVISLGKLAWS